MGRFCTECGEKLKEGAKFCGNCGTACDGERGVKPDAPMASANTRRPYAPSDPKKFQGEVHRNEIVQQRQSSGGGLGHLLAGTAIGAFLGNLFGNSSSTQETVVNHNETIINKYERDEEDEYLDAQDNALYYGDDQEEDYDEDDSEDYEEDNEEDSYDDDECDDCDDDYDDDGDFFDDD